MSFALRDTQSLEPVNSGLLYQIISFQKINVIVCSHYFQKINAIV